MTATNPSLSRWPRALSRLPRCSDRAIGGLAVATIAANVLLVITGGLVRLTGSGLGCPTWPDCAPGSLLPTAELDWHKYVEFGNRTLITVVGGASVALLVAALLARAPRPDVRRGALLAFLGVPAQAVLGGITVRTNLNPWVVSLHFLLSAAIIAVVTWLAVRCREGDAPPVLLVHPLLRRLGGAVVLLTFAVIYLGTLVTGSGPHAGAPDVPRIAVQSRTLAQLHADVVMLLVGLSVALVVALRATDAPRAVCRAAAIVVAVEASQAVIGYVQYFTHLPIALVDLHMLGASLLVVAVIGALLSMRSRTPQAVPSVLVSPAPRQPASLP